MTVRDRRRGGQSAAEFMLMLPIILGLVFGVVEYAYYLGGIHHINYATFVAARGLQGADSKALAGSGDSLSVTSQLLNGNLTSNATLSRTSDGNGVQADLRWEAQLPYFDQLMRAAIGPRNMDAHMSVILGPPECGYELTVSGLTSRYSDNKLKGGGCS